MTDVFDTARPLMGRSEELARAMPALRARAETLRAARI